MPALSVFISGMCLATLIFISMQFFRIGGSLNPMRNDTTHNCVLIAMLNLCVSVVAPILMLFLSPDYYAHYLCCVAYGFGRLNYCFFGHC